MKRPLFFSLIVLVGLALAASAAPEPAGITLKIGDPAPKLQLDKWLKGEAIKEFEKGKIYVIECWATWCGPCIASMPHVTAMQAKFKDKGVVVIGVNVWERDLAAPEPFVKKMGDKMGYSVATDVLPITDDGSTGPGAMATTWLQAAGRNGIPCSFIVDRQGKIAWIGYPMEMERPLKLIADNKFDIAAEAKFTEQMDGLNAQFVKAIKAKDNDKALATLDQMFTLNPSMSCQYSATKLSLLIRKGDYAGANTLAATLAADASSDADSVAAPLAAALMSAADLEKVDTSLAVKLATRAYEANGREGWQYQLLLAKAYAVNKEYDKAVKMQTQAIGQTPAQIKAREQKTLEEYAQKAAEKK